MVNLLPQRQRKISGVVRAASHWYLLQRLPSSSPSPSLSLTHSIFLLLSCCTCPVALHGQHLAALSPPPPPLTGAICSSYSCSCSSSFSLDCSCATHSSRPERSVNAERININRNAQGAQWVRSNNELQCTLKEEIVKNEWCEGFMKEWRDIKQTDRFKLKNIVRVQGGKSPKHID